MSDWIRTEEPSPGVRLLRMEAPRGNALSTETMKAMARAFYDIDKSDARAAVLVGKGRVFGAGVDLVFAHGLGRTEVADFVDAFEALFLQLFSLRVPIVAALNGVALAGGAVLASACDWRIASAEGPFEFGFIEPELGISLPSAALEIAKTAVPAEYWTEAIILGKR